MLYNAKTMYAVCRVGAGSLIVEYITDAKNAEQIKPALPYPVILPVNAYTDKIDDAQPVRVKLAMAYSLSSGNVTPLYVAPDDAGANDYLVTNMVGAYCEAVPFVISACIMPNSWFVTHETEEDPFFDEPEDPQ